MAYPNITPLPTPPNPDSPATFDTLAYPFTQAQVTLAQQINDLVGQLNATFFPDMPVLATVVGSASTPTYSWQIDPNTGMYRAGADVLAFATAGVERLRITATGLLQSSTAIVTSATDVTAGRLLTTAAGPAQAYRQGNVLGTVSQSGGVPTGALIERLATANGEYIRFANGTQICTGTIKVTMATATYCRAEWTYPAAFSDGPRISSSVKIQSASGYGDTTASRDQWGASSTVVVSSVGATVDVYRSYGAPAIPSGASVDVDVIAIGRWF